MVPRITRIPIMVLSHNALVIPDLCRLILTIRSTRWSYFRTLILIIFIGQNTIYLLYGVTVLKQVTESMTSHQSINHILPEVPTQKVALYVKI